MIKQYQYGPLTSLLILICNNQHMQNVNLIGIRRQDKSVWQRRAPLTPRDVKQILTKHPNIKIIVQPSKKRIFSDYEYQTAGAILSEDISECSVILGIKQVPIEKLIPNKTFVYFSHTIKGQLHNMPALDALLQKNIRLIDYEKITDDKDNRLIAFGKYAGMAGAIDFLKGLGQYIMQMGISTPFLHCNCSYKYFDVKDCYSHLKSIGVKIKQKQIPKQLSPMIFAVTGRGRTATGCIQVLLNLPVTKIQPKQIEGIWADRDNPIHRGTIYLVNINTEDCVQPLDSANKFDKIDYYKNPAKYKCVFNTKYLPYISALFHCIFWAPSYPKSYRSEYIAQTKIARYMRCTFFNTKVTCDLDGSIECLAEYTQPQKPFFYYDSNKDINTFDASYQQGKILYLAIDFLPCQLAYDASQHFSQLLKGWVQNIVRSDPTKPLEEQGLLPELRKAVITDKGKLTSAFEYIQELRQQNLKKSLASRLKMKPSLQFEKSNSILQNNVTFVKNIQGEALDFSQ